MIAYLANKAIFVNLGSITILDFELASGRVIGFPNCAH